MTVKKKQKKIVQKKRKNKKPALIIVSVLILAILGIIIYGLSVNSGKSKPKKHINISSGNKSIASCTKNPAFPSKEGMNPPYAIDLRQNDYFLGLQIIEAKTGRVLRRPDWDDFGYLGLYTIDNHGNIYTSPVPYVSIDINPPELQNRILKVDGISGNMEEFLKFSSSKPPTPKNPFGVIGLIFDCDTKSLYATTVAGSTMNDEIGCIYQIDIETKITNSIVGLN